MNLSEFCIRRPAFTIVISLILTLLGLLAFMSLPLRWIPNVTPPQITIMTNYPGANAKLVEHDVTQAIEGTLSGISGIESLTSTSRDGSSQVSLVFKLGRNMDTAAEDVRSSIERVRGVLPKTADNPVVLKADLNESPIMYISFTDSKLNQRELSDYISKYVAPSFETLDGVGSILIYGLQRSTMRISLDPNKMASANITADEVAEILRSQNISLPSGRIKGPDRYYTILTNTSLKTAEQFNDLIIQTSANQLTRLRDIGEAKVVASDMDSVFRIDGRPAIALGVIPQSTANPLTVEKHVQTALQALKRSLPNSMKLEIVYNQADYIRASITSVYEAFFEAVFFVWLVIFVFLCHFRATLIPIITIPVCMVATFAVLAFFNFSINTITLMAFVLAIGLVVDDAIVMLENINRHIEQGMLPFSAAIKGSREMIFPIVVMTLTLAAVYAPIAFTPGLLGVLFREFTYTLAGAVIISGIVGLTLTPMMCARFFKVKHHENPYGVWFSAKMRGLQDRYQSILTLALQKRRWVILSLCVVAVLGGVLYAITPTELAPAEDRSEVDVYIKAPRSASFHYTDNYLKQLEALYQTMPEIKSYFTESGFSGSSYGYQQLTLKPQKERKLSTDAFIKLLTEKTNAISGVMVYVYMPPPALIQFANSTEGSRFGLVVMTTNDYRQLQQATQNLVNLIKKEPGFLYADNRLKWDGEQFQVDIDRNRAADLKVSIPTITNTLSTLIAGRIIGKADDADIVVQLNEVALANPNIFQQLYVRNADGNRINLSQMIAVKETTTPEVFHRNDRLRADTIKMTLAPTMKISTAIEKLTQLAKDNLPNDMKYTFEGEAKSFLDSNGKTILTFALALIFIYLVLVAQFESFIDPLIIMLTVPFAMVGSLLSLKLFGGSLNIYSNIGLITLIGLITKHGILITEFANRLRSQGMAITDAVIEASKLRLRPILMTTAAMVLGAIPLALSFGPGAESRQQVGLVIAGGLLMGTFFSLIVIPIAYSYLAPFKRMVLITDNQEQAHAVNL